MSNPLTALMHAVQVMNLLKTLILRVLKDREELLIDSSGTDPRTGNGRDNSSKETIVLFSRGGYNTIVDEENLFLKSSFDTSENTDDYESARDSEEIIFAKEISTDSQELFPRDYNGFLFGPDVSLLKEKDILPSASLPSDVDSKSEFFSDILEKMENLGVKREDFVIKEFIHCNAMLEPLTSRGKTKVGQIDQHVKRVEAW